MSKDRIYEKLPFDVDNERNVYIRHIKDNVMVRVFDEELEEVPTQKHEGELVYLIKPGDYKVIFRYNPKSYSATTIEEIQALYYDDEFYGDEFYTAEEIYNSMTDGHMVLTKTVKALLAKTKDLFSNFSLARYHYLKSRKRQDTAT